MKLNEKEKQLRDEIAKELFVKLIITGHSEDSFNDAKKSFEMANNFIEAQREIHENDNNYIDIDNWDGIPD